jgi:hypothetical protein
MRTKRVDADIWVAGMDEDLLVFLIPGVNCVPVKPGRASDPVDRVVAEHPDGARAVQAARAQAMAARRTLAEALLVMFVDEEARVDEQIGERFKSPSDTNRSPMRGLPGCGPTAKAALKLLRVFSGSAVAGR